MMMHSFPRMVISDNCLRTGNLSDAVFVKLFDYSVPVGLGVKAPYRSSASTVAFSEAKP